MTDKTIYELIHDRFMRIRTVADAMNRLDPTINPDALTKIGRLNILNSLPQETLDGIKCIICKTGEQCNIERDSLYICPDNPMKGVVTDFIETYIGNPWPQQNFELSPIQLKIILLGLSSPSLGVLASRGMGKSVALALIAIMWCFFCAKGEDVFIVAPTTNQTEKVYSYVCDFLESSKDKKLILGDESIGYLGIEGVRWGQKPQIKWNQGTSLRPACASNTNHGKTMRGQQPTFEIIDESSYIADDIYYRTLKAGMGSNRSDHDNIIIESGTPDVKNHFHDLFFDDRKFGHYLKVKFDYQDGIKCDRYSEEAIERLMAEAGGYDSEEFKSEYRCMFPESVTNFFRNIKHAFSNPVVEYNYQPGMTYIAGLDLGRINDSTVLTIGRYEITPTGDRVDVVHIFEINPAEDLTYPQQYELICEELKAWHVETCYCDYTGPGIPIFESLKALAMQKGLSTGFVDFSFQASNKYPAFMRLRGFMQVGPVPRVRYPDINYDKIKNHPEYPRFLKAFNEFSDIIQKRKSTGNEASKYSVEPSKSRGHDDYVASCICLINGISDSFNDRVGIAAVHSGKESQDYKKSNIMGRPIHHRGERKGLYRKRISYIWRQI